MNHVEIKYSYFSQKAMLNMNGEKASPYSELATLMNRPFTESAAHIIKCLDKEIFDDYEIDFYATDFHFEILKSTSSDSEFCKAVNFHKIESLVPENKLLERLFDIAKQYNIDIIPNTTAYFYCDGNIEPPDKSHFVSKEKPEADIGIFTSSNAIPSTIGTAVVISDSFGISHQSGKNYFCVPKDKLNLFWEFYRFEFITLPMISEYQTAFRYAKLSKEHKVELEAYKEAKPAYYIEDFNKLADEGEKIDIHFFSYPENFYKLKSENAEIAFYKNNSVSAIKAGNVNLVIVDKNDKVISSYAITVIGHRYAEEIRLIPRFEYLKLNERSHIDVIVTPANAEDANRLVWQNSSPDVIQVDESGNIIALKEGKAKISVSGKNASSSFIAEVKPALQSLRFSQNYIRLKCGETVIIDCNIQPDDAPSENLTWEIDNKNIATVNPSKTGRKCQVTAAKSYEGKGNIRCYDQVSKLSAICNIEVISKVKASTCGKIALWCLLLGFIFWISFPISAGASIYGLISDPEPDHRTRYVVCGIISGIMTLIFILLLIETT